MTQPIWIVVALLVTTPASAADKSSKDASSAETPRQKMEKKKASSKGAAPDPKAAAETADSLAAQRAKAVYMYAVESCAESTSRCDAALRDDAERRFMEACRACASDERCDQEHAAIKDGSAKRSINPCGKK